jgi:HK97 family phage portal protein
MTGIPAEAYGGSRGEDHPQAASGTNLLTPAGWFSDWATGGSHTDSGAHVTPDKALTYTAVYASVSLIAGTMSSMSMEVDEIVSPTVTNRIADHDLCEFFNLQFNPDMTGQVGRETGHGHLLTWGNSYTQIVHTLSGRVLELRPIPADICEPRRIKAEGKRDDPNAPVPSWAKVGDVVYDVYNAGRIEVTLPSSEILHIPGLSFDGLRGYSPVAVARQAIGLGLHTEKFGAKFFSQSARPSGFVKFAPGKGFKTDQARLRFREDFERAHAGTDNAHKVVILEDGADWASIGIPPEDAQFLETRQFQRSEINAIYRTPPHLTGDVTSSTSWGTGIEEMDLGFVKHCLRPWMTKVEQEYTRKLLPKTRKFWVRHVVDELLRGDMLKRSQAISALFDRGMVSPNEGRREFGRNPVPGGDSCFVQINMQPLENALAASETEGQISPPPGPPNKPVKPEPPKKAGLAAALRGVFESALSRCIRKEVQAVSRASGKAENFVAWLDEFYSEHEAFVCREIKPALIAWHVGIGGGSPDWAELLSVAHCVLSKADLLNAADGPQEGFAKRVALILEKWEQTRSRNTAETHLRDEI